MGEGAKGGESETEREASESSQLSTACPLPKLRLFPPPPPSVASAGHHSTGPDFSGCRSPGPRSWVLSQWGPRTGGGSTAPQLVGNAQPSAQPRNPMLIRPPGNPTLRRDSETLDPPKANAQRSAPAPREHTLKRLAVPPLSAAPPRAGPSCPRPWLASLSLSLPHRLSLCFSATRPNGPVPWACPLSPRLSI